MQYSMLNSSVCKYIIKKGKHRNPTLIYVGAPFCSPIKTTAKIQLLNKDRKIQSRKTSSIMLATLTIDLFPSYGSYFYFHIHKNKEQKNEEEHASLNELKALTKTPFFQTFAEKCNMRTERLNATLTGIVHMINHPRFMSLYLQLLNKKSKVDTKENTNRPVRRSRLGTIQSSASGSSPLFHPFAAQSRSEINIDPMGKQILGMTSSLDKSRLNCQGSQIVSERNIGRPQQNNMVQTNPMNIESQLDHSLDLSLGPIPKQKNQGRTMRTTPSVLQNAKYSPAEPVDKTLKLTLGLPGQEPNKISSPGQSRNYYIGSQSRNIFGSESDNKVGSSSKDQDKLESGKKRMPYKIPSGSKELKYEENQRLRKIMDGKRRQN